jgi:hypothetical protein
MTDGEKAIFDEIRAFRSEVNNGFKRVHERIDSNEDKIDKVNDIALVNKTKVGTFIAGATFVFSGLFTLLSHFKDKLFP